MQLSETRGWSRSDILHSSRDERRLSECGQFLLSDNADLSPNLIKIRCLLEWVGEWLLLNANSAIFQLYHGENKLISN